METFSTTVVRPSMSSKTIAEEPRGTIPALPSMMSTRPEAARGRMTHSLLLGRFVLCIFQSWD